MHVKTQVSTLNLRSSSSNEHFLLYSCPAEANRSHMPEVTTPARTIIADLAKMVLGGKPLDRDQAMSLASAWPDCPEDLLYWANQVRKAVFGRRVRLCSIVAGKLGACSEDCKWCAQSARWKRPAFDNSVSFINPIRLGSEEIVSKARQALDSCPGRLGIVNSGLKPSPDDIEVLCKAGVGIGREYQNKARLCASLGQLTAEQAHRLVQAGFKRYHHNLETSRRIFSQFVTTHKYEDRLKTLEIARRAGLEICSGGLFGLGETWEDRIDLALTLRDQVRPDGVPMNFLHPIPGTPLQQARPLPPIEILSIIAIFRLIMPASDLLIAGGRVVNLRDLGSMIFQAGASSCMIGNYLTTAGRNARDDLQMIDDLGLEVSEY